MGRESLTLSQVFMTEEEYHNSRSLHDSNGFALVAMTMTPSTFVDRWNNGSNSKTIDMTGSVAPTSHSSSSSSSHHRRRRRHRHSSSSSSSSHRRSRSIDENKEVQTTGCDDATTTKQPKSKTTMPSSSSSPTLTKTKKPSSLPPRSKSESTKKVNETFTMETTSNPSCGTSHKKTGNTTTTAKGALSQRRVLQLQKEHFHRPNDDSATCVTATTMTDHSSSTFSHFNTSAHDRSSISSFSHFTSSAHTRTSSLGAMDFELDSFNCDLFDDLKEEQKTTDGDHEKKKKVNFHPIPLVHDVPKHHRYITQREVQAVWYSNEEIHRMEKRGLRMLKQNIQNGGSLRSVTSSSSSDDSRSNVRKGHKLYDHDLNKSKSWYRKMLSRFGGGNNNNKGSFRGILPPRRHSSNKRRKNSSSKKRQLKRTSSTYSSAAAVAVAAGGTTAAASTIDPKSFVSTDDHLVLLRAKNVDRQKDYTNTLGLLKKVITEHDKKQKKKSHDAGDSSDDDHDNCNKDVMEYRHTTVLEIVLTEQARLNAKKKHLKWGSASTLHKRNCKSLANLYSALSQPSLHEAQDTAEQLYESLQLDDWY